MEPEKIDTNVEENCEFLRKRSKVGFEKYGCPTTDIEGLEGVLHLKEELGDGLNYIAQIERVMEGLIAENTRLKEGLIGTNNRVISVAFLVELYQVAEELGEKTEYDPSSVFERLDKVIALPLKEKNKT